MGQGEFLWCDLACSQADEVTAFYGDLLGWRFTTLSERDLPAYHVAQADSSTVAAIYEMPPSLRDAGMRSFWMPYFGADSVVEAVDAATRAGGACELGPARFRADASIVMLSDPTGQRFTLYDGRHFQPYPKRPRHGAPFRVDLIVPDAAAVEPFYKELMRWQFKPAEPGRKEIRDLAGAQIGTLIEDPDRAADLPNGWLITFACDDLTLAVDQVHAAAGSVSRGDACGGMVCASDAGGALFGLQRTD